MNTPSSAAFTVSEVLKASWDITKKSWKKYLILLGAAALLLLGFSILFGILEGVIGIPDLIEDILSFLLGIYVGIVMVKGALVIVRDQKFDLSELIKVDSKMYLHMLLATFLFYLVVLLGFVLLIIPGIIASLMFCFYSYSIVDKNADAIQSLEDSKNMTDGSKWTIFLFNLCLSLIAFVIVAVPMIILATMSVGVGFSNAGVGPAILVGILGMIVVIAIAAVLSMVGMSGQAYMYTKLRAKTPLAIKK
ncbi:MAG: hypothetical protein AAB776_04355 [Patescibacteria group bacterium]